MQRASKRARQSQIVIRYPARDVHKLRLPTSKQIALAASLGVDVRGKSFRVIAAEIGDALEVKSFEHAERAGIVPGLVVKYVGPRADMPRELTVSTVAITGFIYFKGTPKYCRPWDLRATEGAE